MVFEVMSYGRNPLEKAIFAVFVSLILVFCYTSFQWANQKKNKWALIFVLIVFWLVFLKLIVLFIPLLVSLTSLI